MDPNDPSQLAQLAGAVLLQSLPKGGGGSSGSQKEQLQSLLQQLQAGQASKQQHPGSRGNAHAHSQQQQQQQQQQPQQPHNPQQQAQHLAGPGNTSQGRRSQQQQQQQQHRSQKGESQELLSHIVALLGGKDGSGVGVGGAPTVAQSPPSLSMMRQGSLGGGAPMLPSSSPSRPQQQQLPPQYQQQQQGQRGSQHKQQQMEDLVAAIVTAAEAQQGRRQQQQQQQQAHQQQMPHQTGGRRAGMQSPDMLPKLTRMLEQGPHRTTQQQQPPPQPQQQQALQALQQALAGSGRGVPQQQLPGGGAAAAVLGLLGSLGGEGAGAAQGASNLGQLLMLVAKASKEKLSDVDKALLELAVCQSLLTANSGSPKANTPASPSSQNSGGADPLALLLPAIASKLLQQRGSPCAVPAAEQGLSAGAGVGGTPPGLPAWAQGGSPGPVDASNEVLRMMLLEASAEEGSNRSTRSQESSGSVGRTNAAGGASSAAGPAGALLRSGGDSPLSLRSGDGGAGPGQGAARGSAGPGSRSVSSAAEPLQEDGSPAENMSQQQERGEGTGHRGDPQLDLLHQLLLQQEKGPGQSGQDLQQQQQQQGSQQQGSQWQGGPPPHSPRTPRSWTAPDAQPSAGCDPPRGSSPAVQEGGPSSAGEMGDAAMEELGDIDCSDWINDDMSLLPTPRPGSTSFLQTPRPGRVASELANEGLKPPAGPGGTPMKMEPRQVSAAQGQGQVAPVEEPGEGVNQGRLGPIHIQSLESFDLGFEREGLDRIESHISSSFCPSPSNDTSSHPCASPGSSLGGALSGPPTLSSPEVHAMTEAMSGVAKWVEQAGRAGAATQSPAPSGVQGVSPGRGAAPRHGADGSPVKNEPWTDIPKGKWPEGLELLPLDSPIGELPLASQVVYENSGKKSRTSLGPIRTSSSSGSLGDPEAWKTRGSPSLAGSPACSLSGVPGARSVGYGPSTGSTRGSVGSESPTTPSASGDSQGLDLMEDLQLGAAGSAPQGPGDAAACDMDSQGGGARAKGRGRGSFRRRSQSPARSRRTDRSPSTGAGVRSTSPGRKRAWGDDGQAGNGRAESLSLSQGGGGSGISRTSSGGSDLGAFDGPAAEGGEDTSSIGDVGRSKTEPVGSGRPGGDRGEADAGDRAKGKGTDGHAQNGEAAKKPRQKRGTATDPHSVAARLRRDRISQRMKVLYELVPNARSGDTATMLDEAIRYVRQLQEQVHTLSKDKAPGQGEGSSSNAGPSGSEQGQATAGHSGRSPLLIPREPHHPGSQTSSPSSDAPDSPLRDHARGGLPPPAPSCGPSYRLQSESSNFPDTVAPHGQLLGQGPGGSRKPEEPNSSSGGFEGAGGQTVAGGARVEPRLLGPGGAIPRHPGHLKMPESVSLSSWQGSGSPRTEGMEGVDGGTEGRSLETRRWSTPGAEGEGLPPESLSNRLSDPGSQAPGGPDRSREAGGERGPGASRLGSGAHYLKAAGAQNSSGAHTGPSAGASHAAAVHVSPASGPGYSAPPDGERTHSAANADDATKWPGLEGEIELAMEDITLADLDVTDAPGWGF